MNQTVTLGVGSAASTAEGHTYAFGNTAESLRKKVFGLTQIGDPGDRAFDRTTGEGFVAACQGQYARASHALWRSCHRRPHPSRPPAAAG